ncbi:hypothetical protein [Brevibacillus sp. HD3.3A]|nr:hypothetical protein [Brevibacillus sp. 1238]
MKLAEATNDAMELYEAACRLFAVSGSTWNNSFPIMPCS